MTKLDPKLLAQVLNHPLDDDPRLVLADSLQAKNDPRGELIVAQCRLSESGVSRDERATLKAEATRLLAAHGAEWMAVAKKAGNPIMRRGFVDELTAPAKKLVDEGEEIFATEPITKLTIQSSNGKAIASLAALGAFARVLRVTIRGEIGSAGARNLAAALAKRTIAEPLRSLNVTNTNIDAAGVAALVEVLGGCRMLSLTGNSIGDEGLVALAKANTLSELETLYITANELSDEGVEKLADAVSLVSLEKLSLARNEEVTEESLGAIAHSKKLKALRWLEYSDEDGEQSIAVRNR